MLTHGTIKFNENNVAPGSPVYLVGNGIKDYRSLNDKDPESRVKYGTSGTLRWGSNFIQGQDKFQNFVIDGQAFSTTNNGENAVSGPGDSGGIAYSYNEKGERFLIGILQGGLQYDPCEHDPSKRYFSLGENTELIATRPNNAFSYIINPYKRAKFIEKLIELDPSIK